MDVQDVLPRDAIPSIDAPSFGASYFGDGDDDVIVVEGDPPRAYPVCILNYHEVVNDILGASAPGTGVPPRTARADEGDQGDEGGEGGEWDEGDEWGEVRPIAVTWCPICASAVVYDRRVDGRVLTFGTSGKLADDALVLYDRETGSEWKQPLGTAIDGPLAGRELTALPAPVLSWERFRSEHPDGLVLQPVHGGDDDPRGRTPRAAYDPTRYDRYDEAAAFGLRAMRGEGAERSWDREDIDAKATVLGVVHGGDAVGYPVPQVRAAGGLVTDSVGGLDVVVVGEDGIHAFERPGHALEMRDGTLYGDGASWDPATGRSDDGRELTRVPSRRLYAFAWADDHGRDSFYGL